MLGCIGGWLIDAYHSLDTYIIESLLANREIFLIDSWYGEQLTSVERMRFRDRFIAKSIPPIADYAYNIGEKFKNKTSDEGNLERALEYYLLAKRCGNQKSTDRILGLADHGCHQAQYEAANILYRQRNYTESAKYALEAIYNHHKESERFIATSNFDGPTDFMLANSLLEEQNQESTYSLGISLLVKAIGKGNFDAAIYFGNLWSRDTNPHLSDILGLDHLDRDSELKKLSPIISGYCEIIRNDRTGKAISALEAFATSYNVTYVSLITCYCWLEFYKDYDKAAIWFYKIFNPDNESFVGDLQKQVVTKKEFVLMAARLFEYKKDFKHACLYYGIAEQMNDKESSRKILAIIDASESSETLIDLGDLFFSGNDSLKANFEHAQHCFQKASLLGSSLAEYYLGRVYDNDKNRNFDRIMALQHYMSAISRGCELASIAVEQLLDYRGLTKADVGRVAKLFRERWATEHPQWMLTINRRASESGCLSAAFFLGHYYLSDHPDIPKNNVFALEAFMNAAQLGSQDAFPSLERLGHIVNSEQQMRLSQFYGSLLRNDRHEKSAYWQKKSMDATEFVFKRRRHLGK
ncbi:MAG: hypothetical protein CMF50_03870 [Legionellales bacterium]|nr:hypothetical protein [Legionellales bacterium]